MRFSKVGIFSIPESLFEQMAPFRRFDSCAIVVGERVGLFEIHKMAE